jgi:hypothetical protein
MSRAGPRTNPDQANRFQGSGGVGLGPIGDNSAVAAHDDGTGAFRGASFTGADFTGANFRDCDLLSGLVVNDVDVTAFVEGELDRRHPGRVQLRDKRTAGVSASTRPTDHLVRLRLAGTDSVFLSDRAVSLG